MSIQSSIMRWYLHWSMKRVNKRRKGRAPTVNGFRKWMIRGTKPFQHPSNVRLETLKIGNNNAEWFIPQNPNPKKVLLYLHGGAYIGGDLSTCRAIAGKLAAEVKIKVLSLDYRLAPEHPYPAALDDALEAFKWLEEQGYNANQIIVSGDSAGGGLSLCTAIALRDRYRKQPLALVLISPWTDLSASSETIKTHEHRDPYFMVEHMVPTAQLYAGDLALNDPKISPLFADPKGLCPILVQVGTEEMLLDDSRLLAKRYKKEGVDITLEVWEGVTHVWHIVWKLVPESRKAIRKIAKYIQEK